MSAPRTRRSISTTEIVVWTYAIVEAAAIAAIAFDRKATVVDGNVERVVARLFALETPLPAACTRIVCPAFTFAFSTTICRAVRKQSGSAAASSKESFFGFGRRFASGTLKWRV